MASSTLPSSSSSGNFLASKVSPAFARLVWKEYRTLRAMWVILAAFTVFWQSMTPLLLMYEMAHVGYFCLPAMFALGAAVLLFASETEERTLTLLRVYPMARGPVFFAKVGVALLGAVALAIFVGLVSLFSPWPSLWKVQSWTQWQYSALHLFFWGIAYSLLTGRALPTLVLAPISLVLTLSLPLAASLPILAAVCAADWWLTGRWLNDRPVPLPAFLTRHRARTLPQRFLFISDSASPWKVAFVRLVWLEWQHARPFLFLTLGVGVLVIVIGSWRWFELAFAGFSIPLAYVALLPVLMGAWTFAGEQHQRRYRLAAQRGVAGETLWLSKHAVWLPCAVAACGLLLCFDHIFHWIFESRGSEGFFTRESLWEFIERPFSRADIAGPRESMALWIFLAYSCGQFTSLFLPRAITALIVSLPLLLAFSVWWVIPVNFEIPVLWTVAPIPFVLLAATFVRSSDWLLERTGWRRWAKIGTVLIVPVLPVFIGIIVHRVTEIPTPVAGRISTSYVEGEQYLIVLDGLEHRNPGAWWMPKPSPGPRWTGPVFVPDKDSVYVPRENRFAPKDDSGRAEEEADTPQATAKVWPPDDPELIRWITLALKHSDKIGYDISHNAWNRHKSILAEASKLTVEGKLDEAFAKYLTGFQFARLLIVHGNLWNLYNGYSHLTWEALNAWLVHPNQTPQRIREAIRTLDVEFSRYQSLTEKTLDAYDQQRNGFDAEWSRPAAELREMYRDKSGRPVQKDGELFLWTRRLFPWEKWRTRRLIDATAAAQVYETSQLETKVRSGNEDLGAWLHELSRNTPQGGAYKGLEPWRWWRTTAALPSRDYDYWPYGTHISIIRTTIEQECRRRGGLIVCAIVAHRLEHGALPERLDQLVPASFSVLPTDPWTGREFGYQPNGTSYPILGTVENSWKAKQPLLWSPGSIGGALILDTGRSAQQSPSPHLIMSNRFDSGSGSHPTIFPIP